MTGAAAEGVAEPVAEAVVDAAVEAVAAAVQGFDGAHGWPLLSGVKDHTGDSVPLSKCHARS